LRKGFDAVNLEPDAVKAKEMKEKGNQ